MAAMTSRRERSATGVSNPARSPSTYTWMWLRRLGPSATRRARRPGQRCSSSSMAPSTFAASTSTWRVSPGKSGVRVPGRRRSATSVEHCHVDRRDRGQIVRDLAPRLALVRAGEDLARARAEVDAGGVVRVHRHRLAQDAEVRVRLRQPLPHVLPARAAVARAPDGRLAVVHDAAVAAVDRDDVERLAVVGVRRRGEAEVARQAFGDLVPRLTGVVGAVHADVVLLVHALRVGRADELVDAEADVLVVGGPVAAQTVVSRRPGRAAVLGLEGADALHDREEAVGVVGLRDEAGDPEMPGRLVRRIVPALAAVLPGERRQQRPGLAVVAALEDARRLDADEQPVAGARERRHLGDPAAVLVTVGEAFARVLPSLAQVVTAPDGGAVPLACGGGEDRACLRVVDRVVDGPSFAIRAAQRPVAAVVALEHEGALA